MADKVNPFAKAKSLDHFVQLLREELIKAGHGVEDWRPRGVWIRDDDRVVFNIDVELTSPQPEWLAMFEGELSKKGPSQSNTLSGTIHVKYLPRIQKMLNHNTATQMNALPGVIGKNKKYERFNHRINALDRRIDDAQIAREKVEEERAKQYDKDNPQYDCTTGLPLLGLPNE